MAIEVSDSDGIHALHHNLDVKRSNGWAIPSRDEGNCEVTINSGTLGSASETLTVAAGDALLGGENTPISEQTVSIPAGGPTPRKDVVILSETGEAVRSAGYPESIQPSSDSLRASERPAPPDLQGVSCVPLAIVLVPTQATSITNSGLIDIRPNGDLAVGEINGEDPTTHAPEDGDGTATLSNYATVESDAVETQTVESDGIETGSVQSSGSGIEAPYTWVEQEESNANGDVFRAGGVLTHQRVQPDGETALFDSATVRQALLQIRGRQSENAYFTDLVLYARGGDAMVVGSVERGSVPDRTYGQPSDSELAVTLGDGGDGSALNITVDGRYGDNDPSSA